MKVFISYSRHDETPVRSMVSDLRRARVEVWLDEDLGGGDAWWSEILEQIRGCTVFLFASSDNSLHSKPCRAELGYAEQLGLPILPVQIGEIGSYRAHSIFSRQLIDYREAAAATGFALMGALYEQAAHRRDLPGPLPEGPPIPYEYLQRLGTSIHDAPVLAPSVQAQMLFELRNALAEEDDSTVVEDIRRLLGVLRRRRDVTYPVASEIDVMLGKDALDSSQFVVASPAEHIATVDSHQADAPVPAATTQSAELKQVTVLVASVVHSVDLAAALGVERYREIMTALADRSAGVVQRYGGVVDKSTGEGITAVFGAPAALEDHALRACLAALGIQEETKCLAIEVAHPDRIDLQLRIGLNSGQVIAGEIGSSSLGLVGEQARMAQRMESVAPPGGMMLSGSTARLVEYTAVLLGEPEMVQIIGGAAPMPVRQLLGVGSESGEVGRFDTTLVGRQWEMNTITGILDRVGARHGCVVCVGGPAGIGKSRLVHETAEIARGRGVEVFSTFCESHTGDISFHVVARL
ncbi:MAG: TIR domain-containing protein, partial [Mycobacterium sp.]|nr:TIR domain-containing protein [Mycobacterium sp.]